MMITLKRNDNCRECGAALPAGSRANWYRNGAVYGVGCHSRQGRGAEPLGQRLSRLDRGGYTAAGELIGRVSCGCEDYPCCGH